MIKNTKVTSEDMRRFAYMGALRTWSEWHRASLENPNNNFIKEELERWNNILEQIANYVF